MKYTVKVKSILVVILTICANVLLAQVKNSLATKANSGIQQVIKLEPATIRTNYIKWTAIQNFEELDGTKISYLDFEGAQHDPISRVPIYTNRVLLSKSFNDGAILITNPVYEALTSAESALLPAEMNLEINTVLTYEKKKAYLKYDFIPVRKNGGSGLLEKLVAFDIEIEAKNIAKSGARGQVFASESILKNGNWYKVGVTKDGVYKMDFNYLKNLGIDVALLNPSNIRVYGNGGAAMSIFNSVPKIDDLMESAIYVEGESDGVFNNADFVMFYAKGPNRWLKDNGCSGIGHQLHPYTDTSYYFINVDLGAGKRINSQASVNASATASVSTYDDFAFYENEAVNVVKSGRQWFGEKFDIVTEYSFPFNFANIDLNSLCYAKVNVASRSNSSPNNAANFVINIGANNYTITPPNIQLSPYYADPVSLASGCYQFNATSSNLNVGIKFNKSPTFNDGYGYLDYIELKVRRYLKMNGNELAFRDFASMGAGNVAEFILSDAVVNTMVWDVSDLNNPKNLIGSLNGNNYTFKAQADTAYEYFAFNVGSNALKEPFSYGVVDNQNLHGLAFVDLIIVSHPDFFTEAQRLAELHESNDQLKTVVVTPQMIYNEFSGGNQDATAIKQFAKMFYDRAASVKEMPKYMLLMGDGSYKNRTRSTNGNTNFIPTYESLNSVSFTASYVTDDYYGLLDDSESDGLVEQVDIAVGRLPVKTIDEAKAVVDKIHRYVEPAAIENANVAYCGAASASYSGDWRNVVCFVADDGDSNLHAAQADKLATYVDTTYHQFDIEKIYNDAYKKVSAAGGARYPDVNIAINQRVNKGALLINYTGHGGETGWSQERVLEVGDIASWENGNRLPLFVTATCEFSRYDDPARTSAGEEVILRANGGGIGLLTTTRLAYANFNELLNTNFMKNVFLRDDSTHLFPRIGDVCSITKNLTAISSPGVTNHRNFSLLCDPALRLNFPTYKVLTTSMNTKPISLVGDTMKALSKTTITGYLVDLDGNKLTSFNGIIYPTVYDKQAIQKTLGNDLGSTPMSFKNRKNIIYKGKASVVNGDFTFSFVVPKDINYQYGSGRISYYASNGKKDANGYNEDFLVGGTNTNAPIDNEGPKVDIFMNDNKFVRGSITDENPDLYGVLFDENGINTIGSGIGHDMLAVLDENTEKSVVLNDFYQSDLNSYQSGVVRYPFTKLTEGAHTLSLKAWDVYNNSNTSVTDFVVSSSANLALQHVLNYPNPFTTNTKFMFEHNKPCETLSVSIQVFTVSGRIIKTLENTVKCEGYRSEDISWDGLDDFGDKIGRGVYVYRLKVTASDGTWADKYEKLVVLK